MLLTRRRRQQTDEVVDKRHNAHAGHGRAAQYRGDGAFLNAHMQTVHGFLVAQCALVEELFHQRFVGARGGLHQGVAHQAQLVLQIVRNRDFLAGLARAGVCLARQNVHNARELAALHKRNLHCDHTRAEAIVKGLELLIEVGVFAIHLVNDYYLALAALFTCGHGLFRAHGSAGERAHNYNAAVGRGQRAVGFAFKIKITGNIYQIYLYVFIFKGRHRRTYRNMTLYFLGVKVRYRGAVLDTALTVGNTVKIKERLNQSRFTFTAMAKYRDVADIGRHIVLHNTLPP